MRATLTLVAWRWLLTVEWAFPVRDGHCALLPPVSPEEARGLSSRVGFTAELRFPDGTVEQAEAWIERQYAAGPPGHAPLWLERVPVPGGTEVWVDDEER
jgi:hypothetical protein